MADRKSINRYLGKHGLAQLSDPALIPQLAMGVPDHDAFRKVLITCEPQHRRDCYESLRPYLRFTPKPLDVYIAEAGALAEQQQLPQYDPETLRVTPMRLAEVATKAIAAGDPEVHKNRLILVCGRCRAAQTWYGDDRLLMIRNARTEGWRLEKLGDKEREICPKCCEHDTLMESVLSTARTTKAVH